MSIPDMAPLLLMRSVFSSLCCMLISVDLPSPSGFLCLVFGVDSSKLMVMKAASRCHRLPMDYHETWISGESYLLELEIHYPTSMSRSSSFVVVFIYLLLFPHNSRWWIVCPWWDLIGMWSEWHLARLHVCSAFLRARLGQAWLPTWSGVCLMVWSWALFFLVVIVGVAIVCWVGVFVD